MLINYITEIKPANLQLAFVLAECWIDGSYKPPLYGLQPWLDQNARTVEQNRYYRNLHILNRNHRRLRHKKEAV